MAALRGQPRAQALTGILHGIEASAADGALHDKRHGIRMQLAFTRKSELIDGADVSFRVSGSDSGLVQPRLLIRRSRPYFQQLTNQ